MGLIRLEWLARVAAADGDQVVDNLLVHTLVFARVAGTNRLLDHQRVVDQVTQLNELNATGRFAINGLSTIEHSEHPWLTLGAGVTKLEHDSNVVILLMLGQAARSRIEVITFSKVYASARYIF